VTLPENPTEAQISSYLDALFGNVPDSLDYRWRQLLQAKVVAVGSAGLPMLLKKLPVEREIFYAAIRPALSKLATREHLPALREALERMPELAWLFLEKGWAAEGREPLAKHLVNRGETLDPAALKVLAGAQNPQHCPDLLWHWAANQQGAPDVFPALSFCTPAERKNTLELGWKRARFGLKDRNEIAALAASEGLPDSLAALLDRLMEPVDPPQRQRELAPLMAVTPFSGKPADFPAWLKQNAHRLHWEPTTKGYRLLN
jgi:hypothetical protein